MTGADQLEIVIARQEEVFLADGLVPILSLNAQMDQSVRFDFIFRIIHPFIAEQY